MAEDIKDEFAEVDLGDERRNRRLGEVVSAMAKAPAASVSAASGGWSETMAAYRLLHSEDVTPEALLAPHQEAVAKRGRDHESILVGQDTTEMEFTSMKQMEGIGPLNDDYRRGLFLRVSYAVTEGGVPLGVLHSEIVVRDEEHFRTSVMGLYGGSRACTAHSNDHHIHCFVPFFWNVGRGSGF